VTFEAPVQPIPVRRGPIARVLVILLAVAAMLVWQPWSMANGHLPSTATASLAALASAGPTPSPSPIPTPKPSPTPYVGPVASRLVQYMPFVYGPTQDRFRPIWSIAGVTELADGNIRVAQVPVTPTQGSLEDLAPEEVCRIASFTSALVAVIPADSMRLIGIVAPGLAIAGQTELLRVDRVPLSDFELDIPARPGDDPTRVSVRLFVRSDIAYWTPGAYRFLTESSDGTPRFLYACLVDPGALDGPG
jgi:hypothetical protein